MMKPCCVLVLFILSYVVCAQSHQLGTSVSMIPLYSKLSESSGATVENAVSPYFTASIDYCFTDKNLGLHLSVFKGFALYSVEYSFTNKWVYWTGSSGSEGGCIEHNTIMFKSKIPSKGIFAGLNYKVFQSDNSRHSLFLSESVRLESARYNYVIKDRQYTQVINYVSDSTMTYVSYDSTNMLYSGSSYLDMNDEVSVYVCPGIQYQYKISDKFSINVSAMMILGLGDNLATFKQCTIIPVGQIGFGCRYHFLVKRKN